jgi:hypothetical protein
MNPTQGDVHVNKPLTNISIAYLQDVAGFVADRVFPNIPVTKQSDRYFRYDRSDFWRNQFQKRAPGAESAGGGWKIDNTPTYFANVWALHKDIDDQIRSNADDPLNMDRDATLWLSEQAIISREVNWAAAYFTTGVWTGITGAAADVTGVAASPSTNEVLQWNDVNSNPIEDVRKYSDTMHQLSGKRPNKLTMGRQVWTKLIDHPDMIDRIKYSSTNTTPAMVSKQAVAAIMELDEVLVMDGIQTTSAENPSFETSMTTAFIAGKKALLSYAPASASILQPSAGYTFSWTGLLGAGSMGMRVSNFRMEWLKSDRVEGEMAYDQKAVATDCGVFLNTIVA